MKTLTSWFSQPSCDQFLISPAKILRTCSFVRSLTGFAALTITPVPLRPMLSVFSFAPSSGVSPRLTKPRSTWPAVASATAASEPTSSTCQVTPGWSSAKRFVSAWTGARAPPPPLAVYRPASASGAGVPVRPPHAAASATASSSAARRSRRPTRQAIGGEDYLTGFATEVSGRYRHGLLPANGRLDPAAPPNGALEAAAAHPGRVRVARLPLRRDDRDGDDRAP